MSPDERSFLEKSDFKEIRIAPETSTVTIVLERHARLGAEAITKIELAAVKAIPGMKIVIEEIMAARVDDPAEAIGIVCQRSPASAPWLMAAKGEIESDQLIVSCANSISVARLNSLRCDRTFLQVLSGVSSVVFRDGGLELPPPAPPVLERPKESAVLGAFPSGTITPIKEIVKPERRVIIEAEIFNIDLRDGRRAILSMVATDYTDSIRVKLFDPPKNLVLRDGEWVRIAGRVESDKFERDELVMTPTDIARITIAEREDTAEEKRVELNLHTKFSRQNGMIDVDELFARVKRWGWPGFALTDNAVVQGFPKVYAAAKKAGLKVALGCQINFVNDRKPIAWNFSPKMRIDLSAPTVVFDLETTGLGAISNKVIELAAFRIEKNVIVDEFKTFVNPGERVSDVVRDLTKITDEMLEGAPEWSDSIARFKKFCDGAILVAHNISFDSGFLRGEWGGPLPPLLDTLGLARAILPGIKNFKLGTIAKALDIPLLDAHRASDDARALAKIYIDLRARLKDRGIERLDQLDSLLPEIEARKIHSDDVTVLVREQRGLKNLYKLVSSAHLDHLYMRPRTPASLLSSHRDGLLLGSGATDGPVINAMLGGEDPVLLEKLAGEFDYIEIGPPAIYAEKIAWSSLRSVDETQAVIRRIVELGAKLGKPVVAVSQAHHLDERQHACRKIMKAPRSENIPSLHLRTTNEMLDELFFLGEEIAREVVIDAPKRILEMCGDIAPLPKGFFPPVIDGAADELRAMTMTRASELYGSPSPKVIAEAIEKELKAIIGNGFAVLYLIAMRLCKTSRDNGFVVGSRGSVGSSIVAFLTGITEVNPLPPHYRCATCLKTEFTDAACGPDLPKKECCGKPMERDGYRIPFEAFMGIDGTKVPDIDLNFAGEYQARAMMQIEEEFGRDNVFRAGTISTLQPKTAAFIVNKYLEEHSISWRRAEVERYARGMNQVARTTGQHPGGIVIIPRDKEITDFMPVQRPADRDSGNTITTHFDFHSYEGTIVKVDVLGHECPTAIRMLQEMTGVDPMTVPIDDAQILSLFSSPNALGASDARLGCPVGTLAIPEFGTPLLLQILTETRPKTVEELIRISGLSHGTDVWKGNAQDLIKSGTAKLSEVIATREDIMTELVKKGIDAVAAFAIMEKVRKGKGLAPEDEKLMKQHRIPEWVTASCKKIKYMFPRAHAVAYVLMALRVAWFKVYRPEAFYACWFSLKVSDFDLNVALQGEKAVTKTIAEIRRKMSDRTATPKEESNVVVLEVVREMFARGIALAPIRIGLSDVLKFTAETKAVRAPMLAVPGLGEKVARKLEEELKSGVDTIEDLVLRTSLSKPVVEKLKNYGVFGDLPETNQLTLF